jgi:hypothetical protein
MSIPMQVSIPLALHLRCEVTSDIISGKWWKPGEKYQEKRSVNDFAFVDQRTGRFGATINFASILRQFYYHPDWSQMHAFFTKRYSEPDSSNSDNRKLSPGSTSSKWSSANPLTVNFNTDPSMIGLPKDFVEQLGITTKKAIGNMSGLDPLNCSMGPAISCAIGAGAYMDMIYEGKPPGTAPPRKWLPVVLTEKKGGRGRSPAEWRELWAATADWVYEIEATSIHAFGGSYSYKYRRSNEEKAQHVPGSKVLREHLQTDAIHGADGMRDMFGQLADDPVKFHGIEWDFLALEVGGEVEKAFLSRFGPKPPHAKMCGDLSRHVSQESEYELRNRLNFDGVNPQRFRPCPDSFTGIDWENWMLSIEGGTIVEATSVFQVRLSPLSVLGIADRGLQALWAVMLLSYLPLHINILDINDTFPQFPDLESVYLFGS